MAKETSIRAASKQFNVDRKRVREWLTTEDTPRDRRRHDGGGCRPQNRAIDNLVLEWIRQRREDKQRVTRKMVMNEARRLHVSHPGVDPEFAASSGWLRRFMVRNNIIMRRRTTLAQR